MEILTIIYLTYSFIALYFLFLFFLIYIPNRKEMFNFPNLTKEYSLSIVIPCHNEEETIGGTINSLLELDYKGLKKIIVVDDCSTDNSYKVIEAIAKKHPKVMLVKTPKNTGKASGAKNYGAKFVNTELIGFVDADSYPQKDSVNKMVGFFDDIKTGAVTSQVLVKRREKFIEKLQAIEYKIIAFSRKLLGFIDAIYVTPGPLAIYRKEVFDKVGGFDENNLTEDIEITWHIVYSGYNVKMSLPAKAHTISPDNLKDWFKQRIRWNVGGIQTINKYKKTFLKKGMLGNFILPFFLFSWFVGIFGIFILTYRFLRRIFINYFFTAYSIKAQTALLTLRDINLTPNVLVFFGIGILILSLSFTAIVLLHLRETEFKKHGFLNILSYMFVYLLAYPFLLIASIYKFLRKKRSW
ncbi:MAG: glycosyltransferase [Nanoarchaeota archaeon]